MSKNNVVELTSNYLYETCITIPPVTDGKAFIPKSVIRDEKIRLEDIAVYSVLCGLNGKASFKQLKFRFREPAKDILSCLNHLINLGHIRKLVRAN